MAYTKQTWDTTSYVNPTRMNHIEDGIKNCDNNMDKVRQVVTGSTGTQYRVLLTTTDSDDEETTVLRKCNGLTYQSNNGQLKLARPHSSTELVSENFVIGNDIPLGTEGNVKGCLRLYGQNNRYGQFQDRNGILTGDRTYELPDKSGVLALTSDALKKSSFYAGDVAHTITFSGTAHLRCSAMILICAGQGFVSNPIIIGFKGASVGTGTITGVFVSENNVGVTASNMTVSIPTFASQYGTHTLFQLYPEDEITYTTT